METGVLGVIETGVLVTEPGISNGMSSIGTEVLLIKICDLLRLEDLVCLGILAAYSVNNQLIKR